MLSLRHIIMSVIVTTIFLGCSSSDENKGATQSKEPLTVESIQKDESVVKDEDTLVNTLAPMARNMDENAFIEKAIDTLIPSLVASYVPDGYEEEVLSQDALQTEALKSNQYFSDKLKEFYTLANENTRAGVMSQLTTIVSDISGTIYDFIYNYFFGSSDSTSTDDSSIFDVSLDDVVNWVWGSDDSEAEDVNVSDPTGNGGELVSEALGFNNAMIQGKTFYVVSSKADMVVDVSSDGKTGSGSMGFISMDFNTLIVNGDLALSTSLMGDWSIKMTYLDSDHCIAADAIDASGVVYKSYWFLNNADKAAAKTVAQARSICYQNGWVGGAPTGDSVDESDLVDIADTRDGFEVKTGTTTKEIVNKLINEPSNSADVEDAKYFTRNLRHGALSIYTTNDKPDTLEAYETEVMSRVLAPIAGSSLLGMKDLAVEAMDTTKAFGSEVESDLNASINQLSMRLSALATASSAAMDATMNDNDYHGRATSTYGDQVDIWITDMDTNICLVFFLCESSVDATVHFSVKNNGVNGNYADMQFATRVNAESMNINAINFSKVQSEQAINSFSSNGYALDFNYFEFNRNTGGLQVKGSGSMSEITQNSSKTTATFDNFDTLLMLARQSVDITDYAMVSANLSLDGKINAKSGRTFNGSFYFDAKDTTANKIDGKLIGINAEPTIEGVVKTSLTYKDINVGLNGREQINIMNDVPYLVNSDGSIELVASVYNMFSKTQVENFQRDTYECTPSTNNTYTCKNRFDYNGGGNKTLKFTKAGEIITIGTKKGDYYVVDIKNVGSQSPSEMVLLNVENGGHETIDAFDYNQAQVNNIRVSTHSLDEDVSIDNIGDHSYSMNMKVSKDSQSLDAYMLVSRDTKADTWEYLLSDVSMKNEYGELKIGEFYVKEEGSLRFEDELTNLILGNVIGDYSISVDGLLGLGWSDFENVKALRVKELEMLMHTNGSDDAKVSMNADITRESDIVGTFDSSYAYDQTALSMDSNFTVAVSGSGDTATFTPNVTSSGTIKSLNTEDFTYGIQIEGDTSYLLLSNDATTYQQGFVINTSSINAADSYGAKATLSTSEGNRVINKVHVTNKNGASLGTFDKSIDTQKITYKDGVSEYLYVH